MQSSCSPSSYLAPARLSVNNRVCKPETFSSAPRPHQSLQGWGQCQQSIKNLSFTFQCFLCTAVVSVFRLFIHKLNVKMLQQLAIKFLNFPWSLFYAYLILLCQEKHCDAGLLFFLDWPFMRNHKGCVLLNHDSGLVYSLIRQSFDLILFFPDVNL